MTMLKKGFGMLRCSAAIERPPVVVMGRPGEAEAAILEAALGAREYCGPVICFTEQPVNPEVPCYMSIDRAASYSELFVRLTAKDYETVVLPVIAGSWRESSFYHSAMEVIDDFPKLRIRIMERPCDFHEIGPAVIDEVAETCRAERVCVVLASDSGGPLLAQATTMRGLSIPGDFGVVSSDNFGQCLSCIPPLSSFDLGGALQEVSATIMSTLKNLESLNGEPKRFRFPMRIVERGSL